MLQEQPVALSFRSNSFKRRSMKRDVDRDDRGWTQLHITSRKGDLKAVEKLLDQGADVNALVYGPKSKGVTPLHLAAEGGHIEVMDLLLERANIEARTWGACGWTALHAAAKERKTEAVKFLVEDGAFLPDDITVWNGLMKRGQNSVERLHLVVTLLVVPRIDSHFLLSVLRRLVLSQTLCLNLLNR